MRSIYFCSSDFLNSLKFTTVVSFSHDSMDKNSDRNRKLEISKAISVLSRYISYFIPIPSYHIKNSIIYFPPATIVTQFIHSTFNFRRTNENCEISLKFSLCSTDSLTPRMKIKLEWGTAADSPENLILSIELEKFNEYSFVCVILRCDDHERRPKKACKCEKFCLFSLSMGHET